MATTKAIALYDYFPETPDEIPLEKGKLVLISERNENGLWQGTCGGKQGIFPRSFVALAGGGGTAPTGRYVVPGSGPAPVDQGASSGANSSELSASSEDDDGDITTKLVDSTEKLSAQLTASLQKAATLEKLNSSLSQKLESAGSHSEQIEEYKNEIESLKAELQKAQKEIKSLQKSKEKLQNLMVNSSKSIQLVRQLQEELEKAKAKIILLGHATEEADDQQEEIADLKEELKEANSKKNKYKNHSKKADLKNKELRERLLAGGMEDHEAELQLAVKKVRSLELEVKELEQEMIHLETENVKMAAIIKQTKSDN